MSLRQFYSYFIDIISTNIINMSLLISDFDCLRLSIIEKIYYFQTICIKTFIIQYVYIYLLHRKEEIYKVLLEL